jgi:hypothetical protein
MTNAVISAAAIEALAGRFEGTLLRDGDDGYDVARKVWSGCFDRRPALIARCTSVADVQAAVNFAQEYSLTVSVRSGGHSNRGYGTWDDALVIDLASMKAIEIAPETQVARAQAGLTWGEFDAATQEHGLAVTGGRFSTTGIAGLTLGSGSGWLERRCGLTLDNLLAAEVVTADGNVLTASAEENAELFWGLRGGGGNFGIVTTFTYQLHRIGPMIYGGLMACPPERAGEILRFMRKYMADAPDDLGAGITFISAPPEPFVPTELHLAPITGLMICWTGEMDEGERVVAPIREVAQPVLDMVRPMPYTAMQSMLDRGAPHGVRAHMKAEFIPELTDELIEKLIRHGASRPGPLVKLLLEPMGGAISRMGNNETALGNRDIPWCYHALSLWADPSEEAAAAHIGWAKELAADLAPHTASGVYLNYTSDEGEERIRSTYGPARYARLVALKDRYDPTNLFHLNANIRPSRWSLSA